MPTIDLDLASEPPSRIQGAALRAAEALTVGQALRLRLAEPPEILLHAVNNHLRGTLRWTVEQDADEFFIVTLQRSEDVSPQGVIDLLLRHHQRLDGLLIRALHLAQGGDAKTAGRLLSEFARELRAHIEIENELLAPRFGHEAAPDDPASTMLREHDELLQQVSLIEAVVEADGGAMGDVEPFLAILSGTLAKHEHREENQLFPQWHNALERAPAGAREDLFGQIRDKLGTPR